MSELSVFDLLSELNPSDPDLCLANDAQIASRFEDVEDLSESYYYLCYGNLHDSLPSVALKINSIFSEYIDSSDYIEWWRLSAYKDWLSHELVNKLASKWLDSSESIDTWISESISPESELIIPALEKLVALYKKQRNANNVEAIGNLFLRVSSDDLDEGCEIIHKSTPAVTAFLLSREDIDEKYTLSGLKAISKLSTRRSVNVVIDFKTLGHLGPKSRLNAMAHLLDIIRARDDAESLFKSIPKREDVELFLFPCSLKYNDQVVKLLQKFDSFVLGKK